MDKIQILTQIELAPFDIPTCVRQKGSLGLRQEGFQAAPVMHVQDVDPETLSRLCDAFRAGVFELAGQKDPRQNVDNPSKPTWPQGAVVSESGEEKSPGVYIPAEVAGRAIDALSCRINVVGEDPNTHGTDGVAKLFQESMRNDELAREALCKAVETQLPRP